VRNKRQEGIIANALLRARDILDTNVLLCPNGEDIAFVASTNHMEKVWTIHTLASKWPQCDCPLATQGIVCKHVVKVFKMIHPNIRDGSIVRETGTLHRVARGGAIPKHNSFECGIGDNDTFPTSNFSLFFIIPFEI
jgi:hypothetical protein